MSNFIRIVTIFNYFVFLSFSFFYYYYFFYIVFPLYNCFYFSTCTSLSCFSICCDDWCISSCFKYECDMFLEKPRPSLRPHQRQPSHHRHRLYLLPRRAASSSKRSLLVSRMRSCLHSCNIDVCSFQTIACSVSITLQR